MSPLFGSPKFVAARPHPNSSEDQVTRNPKSVLLGTKLVICLTLSAVHRSTQFHAIVAILTNNARYEAMSLQHTSTTFKFPQARTSALAKKSHP
ncbi:hypothetical protein WG66_002475 [Moniliophthora roreri]|nr:hypothetical protein WG66_002475 [Moniliophthora roreri]